MRGLLEMVPVLAGSAVKGTVILALAALAATWLKRGSAASRHMAWQMGLIGLLALPIVSAITPPLFTLEVLPALPQLSTAAPVTPPAQLSEQANNKTIAPPAVQHDKAAPKASPAASEPAIDTPAPPAHVSWRARVGPWLGVIWVLGVIAVLGRFAIGLLVARWYTQRAKPLDAI